MKNIRISWYKVPFKKFHIGRSYSYCKDFNMLGYDLYIGSILIQFMKVTNKSCWEWLPSYMNNGK